MKAILLSVCILCSTFAISQEAPELEIIDKNEIKFNALYLVAAYPEISYEYNISQESSMGVSFAFSIDDDNEYGFHFLPFYRFYFGKKYAAGFLIELHTGIFNEEGYDNFTPGIVDYEYYIGFEVGFSIGYKLLTNNGITGEISLGLGRNFANTDFISEAYPRAAISVGKRF